MIEYAGEVFGEQGLLAKVFQGYQVRPKQIEMALHVANCLDQKTILLCEAGCGSGKSFTSLVPVFKAVDDLEGDYRAIIVTSSILLQEQYMTKDIPFLQDTLGIRLSSTLMKGKNNFLCSMKHGEYLMNLNATNSLFNTLTDTPVDGEGRLGEISRWANETATGDMSELQFRPTRDEWSQFAIVEEDECPGAKECGLECFYERKKSEAQSANIVVTNYHQLFMNIKTGWKIFPPTDVLILDEGHEALEIARDFEEKKVSLYHFESLEKKIKEVSRKLANEAGYDEKDTGIDGLMGTAREFFSDLTRLLRHNIGNSEDKLIIYFESKPITECTILCSEMENVSRKLDQIANRLEPDDNWDDTRADPQIGQAVKTMYKVSELLESYMRTINDVINARRGDLALWIEMDKERAVIHSKPLSVAQYMRENLFGTEVYKDDTGEITGGTSVVITSATLSTDGNFEYLKKEMGIDDLPKSDVDEFIAGTPFDIFNQTMLYVPHPDSICPPTDRDFPDQVARLIYKIVSRTKGRSLCLFTSNFSLNCTKNYLRHNLPGYTILAQGEAPPKQLIEEFKQDVHSILLGSRTFFTGVDIPGESLSCLILDKLPFAPQGDPVSQLVMRQKNGFANYYIPRMIIDFKQAFGRLIRNEQDRGVCVVLDTRLATAKYRKRIFDSFPHKLARSWDMNELLTFCDSL